MIDLGNNRFLVETASELPNLRDAEELFGDGETTSFDDGTPAFHPYLGHRFCGFAVSADDDPRAWYVPVRHRHGLNIPVESFLPWLADLLAPRHGEGGQKRRWINHNVKFDGRFFLCEGFEPSDIGRQMVDTVTLAKTLDTDRTNHELKSLSREWCGLEAPEEHKIAAWLAAAKTKDYGRLPVDLCGDYACADVQYNRTLWRHMQEAVPGDLLGIWRTEVEFTRVLFKMEHRGLPCPVSDIKVQQVKMLRRMVAAAETIERNVGVQFADSSKCMFDIIVNQLGLPVIAYTKGDRDKGEDDSRNPSFDADALTGYAAMPEVFNDERARTTIAAVLDYRDADTHKGHFLDAMLKHRGLDGRVHPSFNQLVRTGRLSVKDPNEHSFDERAKAMLRPEPGNSFLVADASQIEFRWMAHYTEDPDVIAAYAENPDTDYHRLVADMIGVARGAGKTLNFAIGFGAGKAKVQRMLAADKHIIAAVAAQLGAGATAQAYREAIAKKASDVYEDYHRKFPGIRRTSDEAASVCKRRGYVRNAYGRRRHLPSNKAHNSFNTINQGSAMDYIKERMVYLDPFVEEVGCPFMANVHDETLNEGPTELVEEMVASNTFKEILEVQTIPIRVPFRWGVGSSSVSWLEAKKATEGK